MLGALALLGACQRHKYDFDHIVDKDTIAEGGTLVMAENADASKLNPVVIGDATSRDVCDLIFNGLVRPDRRRVDYEGDLASSWEFKDQGKTVVFHLRKGIRWHDGVAFTSKDVEFTWRLIMDPKTATAAKSDFDMVQSIDTPDDLTVRVHYKKPYAPALNAWIIGIVPKHLLEHEKDINKASFNRNPIGTGPYKFMKWQDKQFIQLEANPDYYEGKPHIQRYVMKIIPDESTTLMELKAGSVDLAGLSPDQYSRQTDGADFKRVAAKYHFPGMRNYAYMGFNLKHKPFDDPKIRWALSYAVDRKALIDGVLLGYGKPISGPYVPVMKSYNPEVTPVPCDLTRSAQLLDQAGWKMGPAGVRQKDGKDLAFRLLIPQGDFGKRIVLILQQQFAKVGVKANIETYEWSLFLSNYVNKRDFDALTMMWQFDLDPDQYAIWHSSQTGPEEQNFIGYNNPEVDRLMEQGRTTIDPKKRIALYRRFHAIIAKDQPYLFLFAPDSLSGVSRKFQGMTFTDVGYRRFWYKDWYIPASLQK